MWDIFDKPMIYAVGLLLNAGIWLAAAVFLFFLGKFDIARIGRWCRGNPVGVALAAIGMFWVTPHTQVILSFWSPEVVYALVIVAFILCISFLDFLTARAVAGLLILWTYTSVNANFSYALPTTGIYAGIAYLFALVALGIAAKPYWLRDMMDWFGHRAPIGMKIIAAALMTAYAVVSFTLGVILLGQ